MNSLVTQPIAQSAKAVLRKILGSRTAQNFAFSLGGSAGANFLTNSFSKSSEEICACLEVVNNSLHEIDATLKDAFSGRNVDLGGVNRGLEQTKQQKEAVGLEITKVEGRLTKLEKAFKLPPGLTGLVPVVGDLGAAEELTKQQLEALVVLREFLNNEIKSLEAVKERLEAQPEGAPGGIDPVVMGELNTLLNNLTTAIGGEDGLLAAFLELDAALQRANLPAELEALADAVAVAAARIANAVSSAPKKTAPKGRMAEAASGGTVQPGQPVLVGERGPEIFVPSGPGTIVNGFGARIRGNWWREMKPAA
jgi:hypothetical protein